MLILIVQADYLCCGCFGSLKSTDMSTIQICFSFGPKWIRWIGMNNSTEKGFVVPLKSELASVRHSLSFIFACC